LTITQVNRSTNIQFEVRYIIQSYI